MTPEQRLIDDDMLQLTDLSLPALAVHRAGRFMTFDASVPVRVITGAEKKHVVSL